MARSMNLDVLVRLRDRLTGPLRRLTGTLKGLASFATKIGVLGTAVAAISFMGPINEAAAFQQKLIDIAATANLSGKAAFSFVAQARSEYEELALSIGQVSDTIAAGAGEMIAAGLDRALIDQSIGTIGKAATAANAEFSDMSKVATSMLQTLKLPADQLNDAIGALVVSGKEGAFELKDMARYFPTLTSQMAKYGVVGREAVDFLGAALQIARKGTADPSEAANNLKNFLSKIAAPATIKNFKDAGVDIQAVMADAAVKGINPIEAVMQKIVKLTGVSGGEIEKLMKKAKANGLEGADALGFVREQLEAIHGAGALGNLFSDQQVMDFLIPFLTNVDEYKRIKDEVAKASGAIIDEDFETQMAGMNRQLITFREIGTQAAREVGFGFGTWLPTINGYLMDGLKWYRAWNKESGGLGTRIVALAGGGVMLAAAFGALGIALPIIGAGFAALAALISPVGIALGLIAAAGLHVYRNWNTYGPRVMRIWDRAKQGFRSLAEDMRARGRRIVQAGRETWERYGPTVRRGLASAWTDVKAGLKNLRGLFEGFGRGLNLDVDLSGITIDDVKIGAFRVLETALTGIADAWNALKDFGSGFAPWLERIGENVGSTFKSIGRFADAFKRIGDALDTIYGLDSGKGTGLFKFIGDLAGGSIALATQLVSGFADGLASGAEALADFIESVRDGKPDWSALLPQTVIDLWRDFTGLIDKVIALHRNLAATVAEGIKWESLLPQTIIDAWNSFAGAIERVKSALSGLRGNAAPGDMLPNGGTAGSSEDGSDRDAAHDDYMGGPPKIPFKKAAANSNTAATRFAQAVPRQQVDVGGTVRIVVDGPGKVVSTESDNRKVAIAAGNTGRSVGRV
ncbi:phage tail tape measure protein [Shinella pollutisoli]|uniref:Phage tail tape measure protein n=1 Tax=Shinella pollutisoli TaxID=2250594 RepID=A0ABV7DK47_9HYPH|nr:phage tail tape measure protein [Shinella pollutisoli]